MKFLSCLRNCHESWFIIRWSSVSVLVTSWSPKRNRRNSHSSPRFKYCPGRHALCNFYLHFFIYRVCVLEFWWWVFEQRWICFYDYSLGYQQIGCRVTKLFSRISWWNEQPVSKSFGFGAIFCFHRQKPGEKHFIICQSY